MFASRREMSRAERSEAGRPIA